MKATILKTVLAAMVAFAAMLTLPARAGQAVLSKEQSVAVLEMIRQHGGARIPVGQVVNPMTQQVEQVTYRDILSVDGKATDRAGNLVAVVTLGDEKTANLVPVYSYPVYYWNPATNQWVLYHTFYDANQATTYINWIRNSYRLQTSCTATLIDRRLQFPAIVPANRAVASAGSGGGGGGGGAGNAGQPGILGVQMDGMANSRN